MQRDPLVEAGAAVGDQRALCELGAVAHGEQVEQAFRTFLVFQFAEAQHFLRSGRGFLQGDVARAERVERVERAYDVAIGVDDRLAVTLKSRALLRVGGLDAGIDRAAIELSPTLSL